MPWQVMFGSLRDGAVETAAETVGACRGVRQHGVD